MGKKLHKEIVTDDEDEDISSDDNSFVVKKINRKKYRKHQGNKLKPQRKNKKRKRCSDCQALCQTEGSKLFHEKGSQIIIPQGLNKKCRSQKINAAARRALINRPNQQLRSCTCLPMIIIPDISHRTQAARAMIWEMKQEERQKRCRDLIEKRRQLQEKQKRTCRKKAKKRGKKPRYQRRKAARAVRKKYRTVKSSTIILRRNSPASTCKGKKIRPRIYYTYPRSRKMFYKCKCGNRRSLTINKFMNIPESDTGSVCNCSSQS
ncbi:uncharacterized protein LOC119673144 isoform X1 [Teleopsis dalmanni]|uniref:uncharacterized protein LOC119673144 isoform X1 n=1 Tax=Teleopsis dalmanni TaxID=139649 RepID=UPI0018CE7022|nr:uncharacterized protein LOC119673144 isoform X1 [Teleopsis dalmanni]XP_037940306.1 uncharacterized protein LOC119673144 isoform X1 [Teleopsis dalmanni]